MAASLCIELDTSARGELLRIARAAIRGGLDGDTAPQPDVAGLAPPLTDRLASFVTLTRAGALRGCIGSLEAIEPLAASVAANAWRAAFQDPRFPPLRMAELHDLALSVSVLSPLEPIPAPDRATLLGALEPGIDGLVIDDGAHRATYLPQVWEQLPDPDRFLDQLFLKAGLPPGTWPPGLRCLRYRTLSFAETDTAVV